MVTDGQVQTRRKQASGSRWAGWFPGGRQRGARQVLAVTPTEQGFNFTLFSLEQGRVSLVLEHKHDADRNDVPAAFRAGGHRLRSGLDIVLLLPRRQVLVKHLPVPTRDREQIARMVPYEANAQSPWPREETLCAYEVLEGPTGGNSTLVLYLARVASVEEHLSQLAAQYVRPTRVEVSTRGLERLLGTVGAGASILIQAAGETEYVRLLPGGGSFSRAASGASETPAETLRRAIELGEKFASPQGVSSILYLAGCSAEAASGLSQSSLPEKLIPLDDADFSQLKGMLSLTPERLMSACAALLAEALVETTNLLPASYLRWLEPRRLLLRARATGLLLLWFFALLAGMGYYHYQDQIARAEVARARIDALGADLGDLEAKSEALRLLRGERERVGVPLAVVLELYDKTPSQLAINSMRLESRGLLILGCEAPDFQAVFTFLEALKSSALLEQVELLSSSRPQHAAGGPVEFKVQAQLRAPRREEK